MATRDYYYVKEAAEILGCTQEEVRRKVRKGDIIGHKARKYIHINKDQPIFWKYEETDEEEEVAEENDEDVEWDEEYDEDVAAYDEDEEEECYDEDEEELEQEEYFIDYIKDRQNGSVLFTRMEFVHQELLISVANLKSVKLKGRHILDLLHDLIERRVKVRILYMNSTQGMNTALQDSKYNKLRKSRYFEIRHHSHAHMKLFSFDNEVVYIGSANLTGAGMGTRRKKSKKNNFEAGILTNKPDLVAHVKSHFEQVWRQAEVLKELVVGTRN